MLEKRWILKEVPELSKVQKLASDLNADRILASLLIQRGIDSFEEAKEFFRPKLEDLHNPFLMKGMSRAVDRIQAAMELGENIMIYGDYDVDGTTSVSLVYGFLKEKNYPNLHHYIPDRYAEGYGISYSGIDKAEELEVSLIIALDCGIKAVEKVDYANQKGIDFIICDHHTPGKILPNAHAILNPKQSNCPYPYKELSGCGIGFKLVQALCDAMSYDARDAFQFIDLVAVSIASDIVPITGENRVLCYFGLQKINKNPSPGIKALINIAEYQSQKEMNVRDLVFGIGPRINAAGRMDKAITAVELLLEKDSEKAAEMAALINSQNTNRRDFDSSITVEAVDMIKSSESLKNAKTTVLFKEDWHKGVIGIVASRCIEHYHRPTIIFTESNGKATGSARSVPDYNIYDAILQCEDLLDSFGGHQFAAGLTLKKENLSVFSKRFEQVVSSNISDELLVPRIDVDLEIDLSEIDFALIKKLDQMSPFGPQNMQPIFISKGVRLFSNLRILKEKHLKFQVIQGKSFPYQCIGFNFVDYKDLIDSSESFSICYSISINEFRGERSIQLQIRDIKANETQS
ncbi:MAG: single-stranded-DNA-specific exonuclease RecJ [Cytophagales bacterium]